MEIDTKIIKLVPETMQGLTCVLLFGVLSQCHGLLEQGIFQLTATNKENAIVLTKIMYSKTQIAVSIDCKSNPLLTLTFDWFLLWSPCANEFQNVDVKKIKDKVTHIASNNASRVEDMYFQVEIY